METVYLPQHLLAPFFDQKQIRYRIEDGPEQSGWLNLTVLGRGEVSLLIYTVQSQHTTYSSDSMRVNSAMIDNISWDSAKSEFQAIFDKKTMA
jgi:hypothetical protein